MTPEHLARQVERLCERWPDTRVVGVHAARWQGGDSIAVDGVTFPVHWCPSVLALRESLAEAVGTRLGETAGGLGALLAGGIASGHAGELLPIGLVCDVLFSDEGDTLNPGLVQGAARLEPLLGGQASSLRAAASGRRRRGGSFGRCREIGAASGWDARRSRFRT